MRVRLRSWSSLTLPSQLFLGGLVLLAVVAVVVFVLLTRWAQRSGEGVVRRELEQSADLVAQFLAGRQRGLTGGARVFVQGPYFRAIVAENRRDDIIDQTFEAATQLDADWVFIVDERGVLLAKSDEPGASGVDLGGVPLVAGALQGRITSGFGVSRDSLLFQAVAVPIVVPGGAPLGALVATKVVDSALARDVKETTSAEIVFYVRDDRGPRIAATSFDRALRAPLSADVVSQARAHAEVNGVRYATQGAAVTTAGGEIVGGYVVMSARDAASAEIAEVRRALLLGTLAGVALLALGARVVDRRVSRRLRSLAAIARDADGVVGDAPAVRHAVSDGRDELTALSDAVTVLADDVRDRAVLASVVGAALPTAAHAQTEVAAAGVAAPALSMVRVQGGGARPTASGRGAGAEAPRDTRPVEEVIADRYRVEAVLGGDELATVLRVRDRATGGTVALKRYLPARLGDGAPAAFDALREELRRGDRLVHRNVVRLHDVGEHDGVPFVTMECVEGHSLATVLRAGGPLAEGAVLAIARQLCRALAAAQARGQVHGSLAPRWILLGYDGALKVGDFTLARIERELRAAAAPAGAAARASDIPQLAGATVGAPEYMSPEQLIGEAPSVLTDLYAAGVVLYECVTGATPFRTDSPLAFLAQKLGDSEPAREAAELHARRPSRSAKAHVLADVIARMIASEPARRARSADELLDRLERAG